MSNTDYFRHRLFKHLNRGGEYNYYWVVDADGRRKVSNWWKTTAPAEIPKKACNVYFGVHPTNTNPDELAANEGKHRTQIRTRSSTVAAINCLFCEFDVKDLSRSEIARRLKTAPVPPSVLILSGGGIHCYWLISETFMLSTEAERERARWIQGQWVSLLGGDKNSMDLARVLRVPGTRNYKQAYAPNFPMVTFVGADFSHLYSLDVLSRFVPSQPDRRVSLGVSKQQNADFHLVSNARKALRVLPKEWVHEYRLWIRVGMALWELGDTGLELWDTWSRQSAKYQPGVCAAKWPTLAPKDGPSVTIRSLFYWATQNGSAGGRTYKETKDTRLITNCEERTF